MKLDWISPLQELGFGWKGKKKVKNETTMENAEIESATFHMQSERSAN